MGSARVPLRAIRRETPPVIMPTGWYVSHGEFSSTEIARRHTDFFVHVVTTNRCGGRGTETGLAELFSSPQPNTPIGPDRPNTHRCELFAIRREGNCPRTAPHVPLVANRQFIYPEVRSKQSHGRAHFARSVNTARTRHALFIRQMTLQSCLVPERFFGHRCRYQCNRKLTVNFYNCFSFASKLFFTIKRVVWLPQTQLKWPFPNS